jgi:hypothetical protein
MGMVERRQRADAHELLRAHLDDLDAVLVAGTAAPASSVWDDRARLAAE